MGKAQDYFAAMLRGHIAPNLRDLGFKGSGQVYRLSSDDHWALLAVQRSAFSDSTDLRFTLNLTVAGKRQWEELRAAHAGWPEQPSPSRFYGPSIWQRRIGTLMPEGEDKWWRLTPDTDVKEIADQVVAAVRDYGLPAMSAELRRLSSRSHHE